MKILFFKKLFISLTLLFIGYQVLHLEVSEKFIIKTLIKAFTPYKAEFIEINGSIGSYFKGNVTCIHLVKNGEQIANIENVSWDIPSLSFRDITLKIHRCAVATSKTPINFDFSNLTPSVIGYVVQKIPKSLKRFNAIEIEAFEIQEKKLKVELRRETKNWVGIIGNNKDTLNFSLSSLDDHSKITVDALWEGKKISLNTEIHETSVHFNGNLITSSFISESAAEFLGQELNFSGYLENSGQWQLSEFKATTPNGHKLQGTCEQDGEDLKGSFIYDIPLPGIHKVAKCAITLGGSISAPAIKWHFQEGIEPLETAFGECNVIDFNHLKVTGQLHHDPKNTANLNLDIYLNPFSISGSSFVAVQDLQKFLHAFWPTAQGNLDFKATLKNVTSFENGTISVKGDGQVNDADFHLPINIDLDIKDGNGKGFLKLTKGFYKEHPLDADITFNTTSKELHIQKLKLQLQDLRLAILKSTTYNFEKGLTPTTIEFCGGTLEIRKLKLANKPAETTWAIDLHNIKLKGLKIIFGEEDVTGILSGKIVKVEQKPISLSLNLKNALWQRRHNKQFQKILENLNASLNAELENSVWKWDFKIKDQRKINLESKGQANLGDSTIDTHLKGSVQLKFLNDWLATDDRIFGTISINLRAKGSISSPVLEGAVDADNGIYENSEVGTFYQNITIRTKTQGKRLIVTKFDAQDVTESSNPETGQLSGGGWIDFTDPLSPVFNVPMHLFHLRIAQHDGFISDASGTLTITGKGSNVECKGEVTLEKVSYFLDASPDTKVPKVIDRSQKKDQDKQTKTYATAFPLDILVHTPPGSFKVLGLGTDSSWHGDFYVKKSIVNPFLVGTVTLHEGTLDVLGKVLNITRGTITFVDDDRNNPRLDIRAIKNLGDGVTVAIEIKGTGEKTIVDFTSTPSMPKEEVLALLLFGKKLGEVSVLQSVQLAEIARSDDSGSGFFEKFRSNFGFDQFEFKTTTRGGVSATDEDATPQERAAAKTSQAVRIGKEFGKVRVAIEQGAGSETSKVVVSTPLGNNFALEGDVTGDQNSGVGVNWVKRY